jgi:hypothetical protein
VVTVVTVGLLVVVVVVVVCRKLVLILAQVVQAVTHKSRFGYSDEMA